MEPAFEESLVFLDQHSGLAWLPDVLGNGHLEHRSAQMAVLRPSRRSGPGHILPHRERRYFDTPSASVRAERNSNKTAS